MRTLLWVGVIMRPALSVAAEGTVKVDTPPDYMLVRDEDRVRAVAKYGSREAQAPRAALGAGATAR